MYMICFYDFAHYIINHSEIIFVVFNRGFNENTFLVTVISFAAIS